MNYFTDSPFQRILTKAKLRSYPKGQIVLYEGDAPSDLYIVKSGIVKVYDIDDQGNEKILHLLKAPSMFPIIQFLGGSEEIRSFYTTLTNAEIYAAPQDYVYERMKQDSELTMYIMRWFAKETHELLVRLSSMEKSTTRDKLIAALKFLCVHHTKFTTTDNWRQIAFPVSHQLLADLIGVTRESTTMVMKELQTEKLIRSARLTILEVNFEQLIKL